jgi:PAS domain S-box-containing protein
MPADKKPNQREQELLRQNEELQNRLTEAEDTLRAIREGEVDAVIVSGTKGEQVFSLVGSDSIYRLIVETMKEAAFTVTFDGRILFCNAQFGQFVKRPLEQIVGHSLQEFAAPHHRAEAVALLATAQRRPIKQRLVFQTNDGTAVPAHVSANVINQLDGLSICVVASDLTELENSTELIGQLRQQQEALRNSEERLRLAQESAAVGIWDWDVETGSLDFTPELNKLYGLPPGTVKTYQDWRDRVHPDDIVRVETQRDEAIGKHEPFDLEFRGRHSSGEYRWISTKGGAIYGETGKAMRVFGVNIDITNRKRVEEALRKHQEELRAVLDLAPVAIWIAHDTQCLQITGNRYADEFIMRAPRSSNISASAQPDDAAVSYRVRRNGVELKPEELPAQMAAATGQLVAPEMLELVFPDGRTTHLMMGASPLFDAEGRVRGSVAAGVDVTMLKQTEEALRASEARLRLAQVAAKAGAWEWDIQTNGNFWSDELWKLYGLEPHSCEASYDAWLATVHPDDREKTAQAVQEAARVGAELFAEWRMQDRDGTERWMMSRGQPMRDARGRVVRYIGIVVDITERRQMETELRNTHDLLEEKVAERTRELTVKTEQLLQAQKMEAIGRLAGGVAHDFNNLMTVVTGYGRRVLRDNGLDDAHRTAVEQMTKAGERAVNLTQQLLGFSRKQVINPVLLDLSETVNEMRKMLATLLGEQIIVTFELAPNPWSVLADPTQITQVIMNLSANARDAMSTEGSLTVRTANVQATAAGDGVHQGIPPGRYVLLSVSDTGTGMTEETREHLFEPFFTTKGPGEGTGLGLASVYGIVQQSGGHIRVDTQLGRGTTFSIYFPAAEVAGDGERAGVSRGVRQASAPRGSETILVVEDEHSICNLLAAELGDLGYRVLSCKTAGDAIREAEAQPGPVDLVLSDVVMPGISGPTLASMLKERKGVKHVLFMSGHTEKLVAQHGVLRKGVEFIRKPFTTETLAQKIRELLDGKTARQ